MPQLLVLIHRTAARSRTVNENMSPSICVCFNNYACTRTFLVSAINALDISAATFHHSYYLDRATSFFYVTNFMDTRRGDRSSSGRGLNEQTRESLLTLYADQDRPTQKQGIDFFTRIQVPPL